MFVFVFLLNHSPNFLDTLRTHNTIFVTRLVRRHMSRDRRYYHYYYYYYYYKLQFRRDLANVRGVNAFQYITLHALRGSVVWYAFVARLIQPRDDVPFYWITAAASRTLCAFCVRVREKSALFFSSFAR